MLKNFLIVALGGAFGSTLRYLIMILMRNIGISNIPLGTFAVNIIGCFLAGLFCSKLDANGHGRLLAVIGFCGGFTTIFAFSFDNVSMITYHNISVMFIYTIISITLGLFAVFLGIYVSGLFPRS